MNVQTRQEIKELVENLVLNKIDNFSAESEYKPFFQAIFSPKDIIAASIIQSFYTSFGMSAYEQIAVILARSAGFYAERQYTLLGSIDSATESLISSHYEGLKTALKNKRNVILDKNAEIEMIRNSIQPGIAGIDGDSTVDVFIKKPDGSEYYFDITTVKNNLKSFEVLKLKMLRWVALRLSQDRQANVNTLIAIPYNPYYPADYIESRWNSTILDGTNDIVVQEEFWNFVGNSPTTYTELIAIFTEVGQELEAKINNFFNNI